MRNKKIAGVCAGFANYFGIDVTLIRILWLLSLIVAGTGFLAYIVAWIAMPREEDVARSQAS
jgi:phage shock protein PspC (stress-responsive transcriptional regulator)